MLSDTGCLDVAAVARFSVSMTGDWGFFGVQRLPHLLIPSFIILFFSSLRLRARPDMS